MAAFIESNNPRVISYGFFLDEDATSMSVVAVHPDSEALELHMDVGNAEFRKFADLVDLTSITVYGKVSDAVLERLNQRLRCSEVVRWRCTTRRRRLLADAAHDSAVAPPARRHVFTPIRPERPAAQSKDRVRSRYRRHWWLAAGLFSLAACGGDAPASEGNRAVTVSSDAIQVLTTLDAVTRVVDLEVASDGRVWVLNSIAPYFVVVGPDGRVERQFGLQGDGPEEFNRPVALVPGMRPGEVWAYDWARNALIRISAEARRDLTLARDSFPRSSLVSFKGAGINPAPPWLERTRDGFVIARARATREESALQLWSADVLLIEQHEPATHVALHMPVADLLGDPTSRYGTATTLVPYPLWTACADGSMGLYDPLTNVLRRFSATREELSDVALPDERQVQMTADVIFEMFFRQFADDRPSAQVPDKEEMRRLTAEQNEEFVRNSAETFPEYSDLRCAPDGMFWLRRFDATTGRLGLGHEWLRVAADGSRVQVTVPQNFTTFRIGHERIWGTSQDGLGVESIAWIGLDALR